MNKVESKRWYADYYRTTDDIEYRSIHFLRDFLFQHRLRFIVLFRTAETTKFAVIRFLCKIWLFVLCRKYGLEIKAGTRIGSGFVLTHPYNITVSPAAVIGKNVTLLKGVSIGMNKGGAPEIGNRVYVGFNSTILGGCKIGNDVVIAPNQFVNFDVPDHSIVLNGIHHKENATEGLIWKVFSE